MDKAKLTKQTHYIARDRADLLAYQDPPTCICMSGHKCFGGACEKECIGSEPFGNTISCKEVVPAQRLPLQNHSNHLHSLHTSIHFLHQVVYQQQEPSFHHAVCRLCLILLVRLAKFTCRGSMGTAASWGAEAWQPGR